jgi:hypothetical protein
MSWEVFRLDTNNLAISSATTHSEMMCIVCGNDVYLMGNGV